MQIFLCGSTGTCVTEVQLGTFTFYKHRHPTVRLFYAHIQIICHGVFHLHKKMKHCLNYGIYIHRESKKENIYKISHFQWII